MDLKDIIAITGLGGLYKLESQRNNGVIVKELGQDQSRFVPTRMHAFTLLDNITIYDDGEGTALIDAFIWMKKQEVAVPVPEAKVDDSTLMEYLGKIIPKYDREKVYVSDIRKLVKWYRVLDNLKLVDTVKPEKKEEPKPEEEEKVEAKPEEEAPEVVKPAKAKKPAAKKPAEKKTGKEPAKAKPAKKK